MAQIPGSPLNDEGIPILKPYYHKPRTVKFGDKQLGFSLFRDVIILLGNELYINEKVYPYNEYTLSQLVASGMKYNCAENTKFQIWTWKLKCNFREVLSNCGQQQLSTLKQKDGDEYWITENFVFTAFSVIIDENEEIVNTENPFEALKELVDYWNDNNRYVNFRTNTKVSTAIKATKKLLDYSDSGPDIQQEIKDNKRYPGPAITEALVHGNKTGITWHNPQYEEKFITDVYSFDASSSYPAQCFYGDFPIGELKRCNPTVQNVQTCFNNGYWFVAELISDEIIELPCFAFRPYKKQGTEKYCKFNDGYHYTVTPYDLKNMLEHFKYNPFLDEKLAMIKLAYTDNVGYLNRKYLDFIYKVYQRKSTAKGCVRESVKRTINSIIGKGHPASLADRTPAEQRRWYLSNYMCPQFAQHIVARERYVITSLAHKLGMDKVLSLSTDCIKSTDPRLVEVMTEFNNAHKAHMESIGYTDTKLGMWVPEHYKWLVFIRDRVYFGVTADNTAYRALSSYKVPENLTVDELFDSNFVVKATNQCGVLWQSEEARLKAREDYYGFKMEKHV